MAITQTKVEPNGDTNRVAAGTVSSDVGGEDFVLDVGFQATKVTVFNSTTLVQRDTNAAVPNGFAIERSAAGAASLLADPAGITVAERTVTFPAAFAAAGEVLHYVIEG